jgi:hypothetical protein
LLDYTGPERRVDVLAMHPRRLLSLRSTSVGLALTSALLLAACVPTSATSKTLPTFEAPSSIDATGTQDVTAALVAFIRSVPDGSRITFPADARYRIENIVWLNDRHDLIIDGNGAVFFASTDGSGVTPTGPASVKLQWPRHRDQWLITGGSNITLLNLTVRGANPAAGLGDGAYVAALEAQSGVEFSGTTTGLLANCTISDPYGDMVYIGQRATGITVRDCTLARSGRQGVTVSDARNVTIDTNRISSIRRTAIDLETYTSTWSVTNVRVVNNTFGPTRGDVVAAKGQGDVSAVVVAYNRLSNQPLTVRNTPPSTLSPRRHEWSVIGNTSDTAFGSPHGFVWITYTDNVRVSDNYQPLQAGRSPPQISIESTGSTGVVVANNTCPMT